jgi:dolichol-phosphate mannosyltransferase
MTELAVIIPVFNERENVLPMVQALKRTLAGIDFEMIFVDDDSPDGSADLIRSLARTEPNVRVVQRVNRRGLASAVVEGMLSSAAPYLAVLDGDMQHDESILPEMLRRIKQDELDIVIGTRNSGGGSMGSFSTGRVLLSNVGKRISAMLAQVSVSDPMSGFFMVTRGYLNEVVRSLSAVGFKILLDLLASSRRPARVAEIGYTFRDRSHGESKLSATVCLEYVELILDKMIGDWIPVRYAFFGLIGAVGVLAQLAIVAGVLYKLPLMRAQAVGAFCAMILNYGLNNRLTFRARRRRGMAWLSGLLGFMAACSVGLYCNLQVAEGVYNSGIPWLPSSLAGIFVGSVWNYGVSSMLVWRVNRRYLRVEKATAQIRSSAQNPAIPITGTR